MSPIQWEKGGDAWVVRAQSDRVELHSSIAGAPGSRLAGALNTGTPIRVRVAKCRRLQGEALFVIEGRLLDATRSVIREVSALAQAQGLGDTKGENTAEGDLP